MTSHPTLRLLALAAMAAIAAPAMAQSDAYYYGGLSVGPSRGQIDEGRIARDLAGTGFTVDSIRRDTRTTAFRFFGGYQFNPYIGLEAGYFNLGKFGFDATTTPAGGINGQIKFQGISVDAVGTLPITDRFSALGRIGSNYTKARDDFNGSGALSAINNRPSRSQASLKYGLGLQYAFSPSVQLRGEVERYRVDDAAGSQAHVNVTSLSLVFPFGRAQPAAQRTSYTAPTPTPAPRPMVAMAPTPAPEVVVIASPAPLPERHRVSFSADSLFAFDASAVTPEGKLALDAFAKELQGAQFDTISVEGHTDRLGSTAYNQTLSQQRADAVKAYLVGIDGLDGAKIAAVGKSESAPVTKPGDCKGNTPSAELITCLQPDRRVEVEVTGMR
jgi:OOP family OmpA-OmpF porin